MAFEHIFTELTNITMQCQVDKLGTFGKENVLKIVYSSLYQCQN